MGESGDRLEALIEKLKREEYRLTPQRMAVLAALTSGDHPSVEQIHERVKSDFPMTSLATVYKTVGMLKEMGEVLELGFGDGGNRYDGSHPQPHPHLICVECGQISDLDASALISLAEKVTTQTGYRMVSHRLDFFGVCPKCQAESERT
jgi:Fur family peroxide stress response transcriptional regulator